MKVLKMKLLMSTGKTPISENATVTKQGKNMSLINCDPFLNFVQSTSTPVGSDVYIDGLINRLQSHCDANGHSIKPGDLPAFSEATDLMLYQISDQAKHLEVEYHLESEELYHKAAKIYRLAVSVGLVGPNGWLHKLRGVDAHNPLLCENSCCRSFNYGVAA